MPRVRQQPALFQALARLAFPVGHDATPSAGRLQSRLRVRPASDVPTASMSNDPIPAHTAFRCGAAGLAYNEPAFRHFLEIERRKAAQVPRTLLLALVHVRANQGIPVQIGKGLASAIFVALGASVRETDVVGWYREGRVAAAILALPIGAPEDARARVTARVNAAFAVPSLSRLPLRVRLVSLSRHGGRAGLC